MISQIHVLFWLSVAVPATMCFDPDIRHFHQSDTTPGVKFGYMNVEPTENHKLDVNPIKETTQEKITGCLVDCIYEELCVAINVIFDSVENMFRCFLLPTDRYRSRNKFVVAAGMIHFEIVVSLKYGHMLKKLFSFCNYSIQECL